MKGIIVEVNENTAVMLNDRGSFVSIRNKNYTVGQKVKCRKINYSAVTVAIASVLVVIGLGFASFKMYNTPTSYVNLDINPGVRIVFNSFKKVIKVIPLNYDGKALIDAVGETKSDAKECIEQYIAKADELDYFDPDNREIKIEVSSAREGMFKDLVEIVTLIGEENSDITFIINEDKNKKDDDAEESEKEENTKDDKDSEDEDDEKSSDKKDSEDEDDEKSSDKKDSKDEEDEKSSEDEDDKNSDDEDEEDNKSQKSKNTDKTKKDKDNEKNAD